MQAALDSLSIPIEVPGLDNLITRVPPLTSEPSPYAAVYNFQWLSAAGTACFLDELRRHDLDAGAGVRRHRGGVPVLQRDFAGPGCS